jgi:hypothetical protein
MTVFAGIGTSITAGSHNTANNNLVSVIANVLGMTPLNKGVANNTSTQMATRFATDIVANAPAMVLIESAAVNDIPSGVSAAVNKINLEGMIQAAQAASIEPVLLTQNLVCSTAWINAMPAYLAGIRALAGEYGLRLIDWYRLDMETWFYLPGNQNTAFHAYIDDFQHPNDAGVALLGPEASRVLLGV